MESYSLSALKYPECSHIQKKNVDVLITEKETQAFTYDANILPLFEAKIQDFKQMKNYSLLRNKLLQCRWKSYLQHLGEKTERFAPFDFPSNNDYHFAKYQVRCIPNNNQVNTRLHLKNGPGVDGYGQMPIPDNMNEFRKGTLFKSAPKKYVKRVPAEKVFGQKVSQKHKLSEKKVSEEKKVSSSKST